MNRLKRILGPQLHNLCLRLFNIKSHAKEHLRGRNLSLHSFEKNAARTMIIRAIIRGRLTGPPPSSAFPFISRAPFQGEVKDCFPPGEGISRSIYLRTSFRTRNYGATRIQLPKLNVSGKVSRLMIPPRGVVIRCPPRNFYFEGNKATGTERVKNSTGEGGGEKSGIRRRTVPSSVKQTALSEVENLNHVLRL